MTPVTSFQCGLEAPHAGPHEYQAVYCTSPARCRQALSVPCPTPSVVAYPLGSTRVYQRTEGAEGAREAER